MWQYHSHNVDGYTVCGRTVVRVMLMKGEECFCYFQDYREMPEDSVIVAYANLVAEQKNQEEIVE